MAALASSALVAGALSTPASAAPAAAPTGYLEVTAAGGVFAFGAAVLAGSPAASRLTVRSPIVAIAETPTGKGYWLVGADGGVFTYGDAGYFGSVPSVTTKKLDAPIVGFVPTPTGKGYWLVGADGGVFAFGDAGFAGSLRSLHVTPAAPIVGIAATRRAGATGSWAPTAACSPSATPATSGTSPTCSGGPPVSDRGDSGDHRRRGLLGGAERRCGVTLRRCRVLRVDADHRRGAHRPDRRDHGHPHGQGLLARGRRRGRVHLR